MTKLKIDQILLLIKSIILMNDTNKETIKKKNIDFFSKNFRYKDSIGKIDTYKILYNEITEIIKNTDRLLDIGHGGTFDYDTTAVNTIVGLDLDKMIETQFIPKNVHLEIGSALDVPNKLINFDKVLFVMLIHHLVGKNVDENLENLSKCIYQCKKTLSKNGELIIVESCVPKWFYSIEKLLFKPTSYFINKFMKHPPAFQFTKEIIFENLIKNGFKEVKIRKIKQGKFILQYGIKFPTILTPVETVIFSAKI